MIVPFCKTESFRKSYFNRVVYLWNSLPQKVRSAVDIKIFIKGQYPGKWHVFDLALLYIFECLNE